MIEVKGLTKRYGSHAAVKDISFSVGDGEILGFLGPNGAGKTTTMNIITGYIAPTEGEVFINGANVVEEPKKAKKNIGYLPDTPPVYDNMTVLEYLGFVSEIKEVKSDQRKKMISKIMDSVKITDMSNRLIKNLSKGYRQRVGLAQAMMGYPSVIILDEPTVGLDPKQIIEMRDVIKSLGGKHTIILSSHIMQEVSAVCDRIMIINKGEIVASDSKDALSKQMGESHRVFVRIKGEKSKAEAALTGISTIEAISYEGIKENDTTDFMLTSKENEDIREAVFNAMAALSMPILVMKPMDLTLEEIYLQITSNNEGVIS